MIDKLKLAVVDEVRTGGDQDISITDIPKLKETNTMRVGSTVKNPLPYLMLNVVADLMHEVILLSGGELLVGDGDCAIFMLPLHRSRDVHLCSSLAMGAAVLNEHPGRSESERVNGEVRHSCRRRAFLVVS